MEFRAGVLTVSGVTPRNLWDPEAVLAEGRSGIVVLAAVVTVLRRF